MENMSRVSTTRLSRVEEDVVCRYHFNFIFIGRQAADVIDKLTASDMHEAMLELVAANHLDQEEATLRSSMRASMTSARSSMKVSNAQTQRYSASCRTSVSEAAKTVYVKIADGSGGDLAKIRCLAASSWDSSLPSLKDEQAVRENLFVYLYDDGDPSNNPLDVLNSAFAQMQFRYKILFKRGSRPPALRATVLRHRSTESDMAAEFDDDDDDGDELSDQALQGFLNKIDDYTKYGPMKHKTLKTLSFEKPGFVYDAVEDLGRQMSRATLSTCPTTVWDDGQSSKSRLCSIL